MANDVFTFTEEGKEYKIVMYAGLTNKVASLIGTMDFEELLLNMKTQEDVIKTLLSKYNDDGTVDGYIYTPFKLSRENWTSLVGWAFESVSDFLLDLMEKTLPTVEKIKKKRSEVIKAG